MAATSLRIIGTILGACLLTVWLAAPLSAQEGPRSVIERLDEALIEVMRGAQQLGYDGRYQILAPVLEESFDFRFMARVAIGKHWKELDKVQKKQLVDSFTKLSIATFATRFDGYGGEVFEIEGQTKHRKNSVLVQNALVKPSGEKIPINYLVREIDGGWRVIDVFLDAKYSELAVKRSEYSSLVEREGFNGLIASIEAKIADFASTGG